MDEWKIPGLAVAVVQNGEVALVKAYGLRDANDAMAPGLRRPPGRPSDPI
jgi:CubicO group peptidase (beta-lactamase class C family)